jgi:transposase-like protein
VKISCLALFSLAVTHLFSLATFFSETLLRPRLSLRVKLDAKETEIREYLNKGISKRSIAKLVGCAPSTLYQWLERRQLRARKAA